MPPTSETLKTQLKVYEKPLGQGDSRNSNGKENCYSFLQQKSMKDLNVGNNHQLVSQNAINSHNKRPSQDRTKSNASNSGTALNAMDTYNKLMQIMNERMGVKGGSAATNVSRGKSNEKVQKMMQP